jgi:diacylglycerol kinase (ATP)
MRNFPPSTTRIIHNPNSGRTKGQVRASTLLRQLSQMGYQVVTTRGPDHARQLGAELHDQGWNAVICVGGDGTLWDIMERLHPSVSIGFFPTGTVNLFAKNLTIPEMVEPWLKMLEVGVLQQVHVGLANNRPFMNVGSVGFDAHVVARVSTRLKQMIHEGAYAVQAIWDFVNYSIPKYSVVLDGKTFEEEVFGVIVGNGPFYAGHYSILEGANMAVPNLRIALLVGNKKWSLLESARRLTQGTLSEMKNIQFHTVQELIIDSTPPSHVEVDGDPFGITPVTFSVDPFPRTVLVPRVLS